MASLSNEAFLRHWNQQSMLPNANSVASISKLKLGIIATLKLKLAF